MTINIKHKSYIVIHQQYTLYKANFNPVTPNKKSQPSVSSPSDSPGVDTRTETKANDSRSTVRASFITPIEAITPWRTFLASNWEMPSPQNGWVIKCHKATIFLLFFKLQTKDFQHCLQWVCLGIGFFKHNNSNHWDRTLRVATWQKISSDFSSSAETNHSSRHPYFCFSTLGQLKSQCHERIEFWSLDNVLLARCFAGLVIDMAPINHSLLFWTLLGAFLSIQKLDISGSVKVFILQIILPVLRGIAWAQHAAD